MHTTKLPWVFVLVCRLFLLAVCRLLLSWSPGSRACGLSSCSIWASCPEACEILVPQPELEPMSLALDGGFLLTRPPGKSVLTSIFMLALIVDPSYPRDLALTLTTFLLLLPLPGSSSPLPLPLSHTTSDVCNRHL